MRIVQMAYLYIVLALLAGSGDTRAQLRPGTQSCFSKPTPDCLLSQAAYLARNEPDVDQAVLGLADVARVLTKLGRKADADRAFAEVDTLAERSVSLLANIYVVRALFEASRIDQAMRHLETMRHLSDAKMSYNLVGTAAIRALIASGRLAEAERFLAATGGYESDRVAEAYAGAGLAEQALSVIRKMAESSRVMATTRAALAAEKAGHSNAVAVLTASLTDDAVRIALKRAILQQSLTAAFSSAIEKGNLDEAVRLILHVEIEAKRPELFVRAAATACKIGKPELAYKLASEASVIMLKMKRDTTFTVLTIQRGRLEHECGDRQTAVATYTEAKKLIESGPEQLRPAFYGVLAGAYAYAGLPQVALETARLANDKTVILSLVSGLAKAGKIREAIDVIRSEPEGFNWLDKLVAVAEYMPK